MAVLLELSGANMFRTRSYQNASRLVGSLSQDLGELVASGEIFNLKGIGKGLGTAISQAVGEGRWPEDWEDLHTNTPEGLIEMLGIPGVGPKKIKMLHDELGVLSVADLQEACVKNEVAPMKGFGAKSQQKILDGIDLLARFSARRRLDIGLRYGQTFLSMIKDLPGVERAELAGSARRRRETIGDLDIVAAVKPEDVEAVTNEILSLKGIADVKGAGDSKVSVILDTSIFRGWIQFRTPRCKRSGCNWWRILRTIGVWWDNRCTSQTSTISRICVHASLLYRLKRTQHTHATSRSRQGAEAK